VPGFPSAFTRKLFLDSTTQCQVTLQPFRGSASGSQQEGMPAGRSGTSVQARSLTKYTVTKVHATVRKKPNTGLGEPNGDSRSATRCGVHLLQNTHGRRTPVIGTVGLLRIDNRTRDFLKQLINARLVKSGALHMFYGTQIFGQLIAPFLRD